MSLFRCELAATINFKMENNESNYCTLTRFKQSSQRHDQEASGGANHSDYNKTVVANASPFVSSYCTAKRPRRQKTDQAEITMGNEISQENGIKINESDKTLQKKLIEPLEMGKKVAKSDLDDEDNEYQLLEKIDVDENSFDDSLDQASRATFIISDSTDTSPIESYQDSLDFSAKELIQNVPKSSLDNLHDLDSDLPTQANIDLFNNLLDHQEHQSSTQYCTLRKSSTVNPSTTTETDNKAIGKYCTIKLNSKQLDALHVTEHNNIYENKTLEFYLHDLDSYLNEIEEEEVDEEADNAQSVVVQNTEDGQNKIGKLYIISKYLFIVYGRKKKFYVKLFLFPIAAPSFTNDYDMNLTELFNESKTRTGLVDDQNSLMPQKRKVILEKCLTLPKSAKLLAQRLDEEPFARNIFQRATIASNAKQTLPDCVLKLDKHKFNGLFSTGRIDDIGDDNHHENGKRMNAGETKFLCVFLGSCLIEQLTRESRQKRLA